ncbi:helix-turn-helix transcriptional regulator [Paraburkholderia adhaesiva]|uniref:helix-turn-helix transcriptional regulator n=1 Tax=Paraburkholderia adhaesiva TaxID=2883244 RepID=UPI001F4907D1|nr:helix-turn-helix transcriptional regulator [Paraburkholderia adhaesiva]
MLNRALKLIRAFHQLSQTELAKRLGISNSYLSEIESGLKAPSVELLKQYSEIFKIPVSSIMLFSEHLEAQGPGGRLRVKAADKILRLLEWVADKEALTHGN